MNYKTIITGGDRAGDLRIMLSPRELEVLQLLAGGCTYRGVARRLSISAHTVMSHVKNAYRKLEVHTAASAVMRAIQLGLFQPHN